MVLCWHDIELKHRLIISRICPCGKTSQSGRCGSKPICQNICDKLLNCQLHQCQDKCHEGDCEPCSLKITQICDCSQPSQNVVDCNLGVPEKFSCQNICGKNLQCGNHTCTRICHSSEEKCEICPKSPEVVKSCHCGKVPLEEKSRKSCLDEIPSCGNVCGKKLLCGPVGKNHTCEEICHEGDCPKCPMTTDVSTMMSVIINLIA